MLDQTQSPNQSDIKQGLVQDYSQRIEDGYIVRQRLPRLKLYRLIWV